MSTTPPTPWSAASPRSGSPKRRRQNGRNDRSVRSTRSGIRLGLVQGRLANNREGQVTDTAPTPLHPRPRLTRDRWVDLCGTWEFAYDDDNVGLDGRWFDYPERFLKLITVPFPPESELSGIGDKTYHPVVWYRRNYSPMPGDGERLILHFGAVDYRAQVWVNGNLVATHEGGHSPFSADITNCLSDATDQVVVVRAEDQPLDGTMPRGKQDWQPTPHAIWYDRTTGIWQPVWLEPVPATYVTSFHLTPDLPQSRVTVEAQLNRPH